MSIADSAPALFTDAEFQRLVRSGGLGDVRVELRRGSIRKMSPQYVPHAHVKMALIYALAAALKAAGLTWAVWSEASVAFGDGFEPLPDIVVFDASSLDADHDGPIPARAVKLVVEVSDKTLADDLGEKLVDYARGGLREYLVADVRGRVIFQHAEIVGDTYNRRETRQFGEIFAALTDPSITIDSSTLR